MTAEGGERADARSGWKGREFFVGGVRVGLVYGGEIVPEFAAEWRGKAIEDDAGGCRWFTSEPEARANIEAAADAEIDALLAARGWRYVMCETCGGCGESHPDHYSHHPARTAGGALCCCAGPTSPCPDCRDGVRRVRT